MNKPWAKPPHEGNQTNLILNTEVFQHVSLTAQTQRSLPAGTQSISTAFTHSKCRMHFHKKNPTKTPNPNQQNNSNRTAPSLNGKRWADSHLC